MNVFGQLKKATLEILGSSPSGNVTGRIWWRSDTGKAQADSGTQKRDFILNDDKAIIGTSGTAASNIRFHRGAAGVLQQVLGSDVTAEGTLSTALAQSSSRAENYTNAGKPAFGNAGRLAYLTDLFALGLDIGTAWKYLVDTDTAQTLTNKTIVAGSNTITGITVTMMSSAGQPAGQIPQSDGANNVAWVDPTTLTKVSFTPQSADPTPATGVTFYSDGTVRAAGVWTYDGTGWVQLSGSRTQEFVLKEYQTVRLATTANGTLATAFANGQSIDSVTLATNDIILLKNQTTQTENGVYTVQASGAPVRHSSADTFSELNNYSVTVTAGTTNANTIWFQTAVLTSLSDNQVWAATPATQSFVVPAGVYSINYLACGAGGGGGGGSSSTGVAGGGGGGGGGGYYNSGSFKVTPGQTLTITIGVGGAGGANGAGAGAIAGSSGTVTSIVGTGVSITFTGGGGGGKGASSGGSAGAGQDTDVVSGGTAGSKAGGGGAPFVIGGVAGTGGSGIGIWSGGGGGGEPSGIARAGGKSPYITTAATGGSTTANGGGGGGGGASLGAGGNGTNAVDGTANNPALTSTGGGGGGGRGSNTNNGSAGRGARGGAGYALFGW